MYWFKLNRPYIKGLILAIALLILNDTNLTAQILSPDTSKKESDIPVWAKDSLGRRTPRGTVEGFIKAISTQEYKIAGKYLKLDSSINKYQDTAYLVRGFQYLLEKNGRLFPYSRISNEPNGVEDDDMGPDLDQVGVASINGDSFDLILERTQDTSGAPIWLFSPQTIQRIPQPAEEKIEPSLVDKASPGVLHRTLWGGVPITHWFGVIIVIIGSYLFTGLLLKLLTHLIPVIWKKAKVEPLSGIIHSFILPVRLYLTVWVSIVVCRVIGISIIVRQRFSDIALIAAAVAVLLLLWQLMNFSSRYIERRMIQKGNLSAIAIVLFMRRAAKIALVTLGIILILDTIGFNVTTWLAGLGIVGIALALGTQKTVENFVGSVTIIADQPVRIGDFCKVGDISGTIEQIGMRTTKLRTNNRTVVNIPNGEFSSMKIENFSPRDRFLFNPTFLLRLDTTSAQLKVVRDTIKAILLDEKLVNPDPARVRLVSVDKDGFKIEIFSFIDTVDFNEFAELQESMLLKMVEAIEASGAHLAIPAQHIYMTEKPGTEKQLSENNPKEN